MTTAGIFRAFGTVPALAVHRYVPRSHSYSRTQLLSRCKSRSSDNQLFVARRVLLRGQALIAAERQGPSIL